MACPLLQVQVSQPEPTLAFRGRKTGALQVRRKLATNAVMHNYRAPPTVPVAALPVKGMPVQKTLDELFKRQTAAPVAETAVDMDVL